MSFSRRSSRRVPPKSRDPRTGAQLPPDESGSAGAPDGGSTGFTGSPGSSGSPGSPGSTRGPTGGALGAGGATGPGPIRPGSRAANRAAKRASSGVRPKQVVRGRVSGRKSRGYNPALLWLAIGAVVIGAAVVFLGNPFGVGPGASPSGAVGTPTVYGDGTCPTTQPDALPGGESRLVTIETELGDIVIKVEGVFSPIAAGNFVALAECEYYDGLVFHRTPTLGDGTPFVIQGGDPNGDGSGGPGYTIADEPVAKAYVRGTVAMARTPQPNSQGSQFFIVLDDKDGPILQGGGYAIFGEVVSGMDVADAIYQASGGEELPTDPIAMITVTVSAVPAATASPVPASVAPTVAASPAASASAATVAPTTAP